MLTETQVTKRVRGYCALCTSRCGSIAVVENGRFVALEPDPQHPTGQALCAKGRAAPELVYHPERLLYPLRRTRPKGDPDPGWQRIGWDEALRQIADNLRRIAGEHGPESVTFGSASPSTSGLDDSLPWLERLMHAFGGQNLSVAFELCGWGRFGANTYTYGASVPGSYMPDLENAGCILFWGYNPNLARLTHATATVAALRRGARLIVVDPRRIGVAKKADHWLRVRPGSDGALALGLSHVMIENGWYDETFIRQWTNAPLLVRGDNGRLLTAADLSAADSPRQLVAWSQAGGGTVLYDPDTLRYEKEIRELALAGAFEMQTLTGPVHCRPVFDHVAELCRRYPPERVEAICDVDRQQVAAAARMLWEARPVAYYAWSGVEMQTNATQIARAIGQLYALTGSFDAPGGNVAFEAATTAGVSHVALAAGEERRPALGFHERPLGGARWQLTTTGELYRGILERQPYGIHGFVNFGSNLLLSHADSLWGRDALAALDFYVHADLFMNPTAELADVVLPVASAFEREALKIGFEVSPQAQSRVQLRQRVVEPRGESRSDVDIIFDLAVRLGLGRYFWEGDVDAAYRYRLGPSGVTLEELRENPGGVQAPVQTRYRKYARQDGDTPRGFNTPTRKVELYSETMLAHGYPPLPTYEEPLVSPLSRPDLAERYPLVLTCAKHVLFCESQHRNIAKLRRQAREPEVEMHPAAAAERGIKAGDWVHIETPEGSVRARAKFDETLAPNVVCGQHGWWQSCKEIGAPGYDPLGPGGANYNLIIGNAAVDPVSGSVPHRAYICQLRLA